MSARNQPQHKNTLSHQLYQLWKKIISHPPSALFCFCGRNRTCLTLLSKNANKVVRSWWWKKWTDPLKERVQITEKNEIFSFHFFFTTQVEKNLKLIIFLHNFTLSCNQKNLDPKGSISFNFDHWGKKVWPMIALNISKGFYHWRDEGRWLCRHPGAEFSNLFPDVIFAGHQIANVEVEKMRNNATKRDKWDFHPSTMGHVYCFVVREQSDCVLALEYPTESWTTTKSSIPHASSISWTNFGANICIFTIVDGHKLDSW